MSTIEGVQYDLNELGELLSAIGVFFMQMGFA